MPNGQALSSLFRLQAHSNAPLISIVTAEHSNRLQYCAQFIFEIVLQCNFEIVSAEAKPRSNFLISYGIESTQGALFMPSSGFLQEKEVRAFEPVIKQSNNLPEVFFGDENIFDVFAAVFYFISRYEEWQAFKADEHGRFEAKQAFTFRNSVHNIPLVDGWIMDLKNKLQAKFPAFNPPTRTFQIISTIDIDNLFAYKGKGLIRSIGASFKDATKLNFKGIVERISVLLHVKNDPFDIYEEVSDFCFEKKIPLLFFFLMKTGTKYDRSVKPTSKYFSKVIQQVKANMAFVGLHPSYNATVYNDLLLEELALLKEAAGQNIELSRQHFLRYKQQLTPKQLLAAGIHFDFSCGFASKTGFRAGTSFPFYYYDFSSEQGLNFVQVPFCAMDGVWSEYGSKSTQQAYAELMALAAEIKKVNGLFITVYHERSFSDHLYKGFGSLYKKLHSDIGRAG